MTPDEQAAYDAIARVQQPSAQATAAAQLIGMFFGLMKEFNPPPGEAHSLVEGLFAALLSMIGPDRVAEAIGYYSLCHEAILHAG